jgi:aerobic carbon-monoxide dehydrogenase medium subunit
MAVYYRRLPKMGYIKPGSVDEVLDLLAESNEGQYLIYAGGTDVIPKIKKRVMVAPRFMIDLKGLKGQDYVDYDDIKGLRIGALATLRSVAESKIVKERFPILAQASGSIASIQIRNRATLAGNICNAAPSADSAPALLTLDAELLCMSNKGERMLRIEEFFKGPGKTSLEPDEILKEIRIPTTPEQTEGTYIKLSPRSRMDLAIVGVAVLGKTGGGLLKDMRIGLGAVAPTPMRALKAEELLRDAGVDEKNIDDAARMAASESKPIDDHRASAEYRRMMVEVLVRRGLKEIINVH